MNLLSHNIKVALRNILKYKVQTLVSVLSLAVGMVTLSVVHSFLLNFQPSAICSEPYYDRTCAINFSMKQTQTSVNVNADIVRALNANGGLRSIEAGPYAPNGIVQGAWTEFTMSDGRARKLQMDVVPIDGHYLNFSGIRSAITGENVRVLKNNEAVISNVDAQKIFGKANPIGASLLLSRDGQNYRLKVVDVYENFSNMERILKAGCLYYTLCDLENMDFGNDCYVKWLDAVLKEDATPKQLEAEVNERLKPLEIEASVSMLEDELDESYSETRIASTLSYLIGSLVLVAAVIGFLRMQIQLFWMRRREYSLRIVNGATRNQLFCMLATENVIILLAACAVAVMMSVWVQDFVMARLSEFTDELGGIRNLCTYCMAIGAAVLLLCLGVTWLLLNRVCNIKSLEAGMRKSHSHWFRNFMLGVQVAISIFFLTATFDFVQLTGKFADFNNIPENEDVYENSLYMKTSDADDVNKLCEELLKLPEVEKYIPFEEGFYHFDGLSENEQIGKFLFESRGIDFSGETNFCTFRTSDVSWLDYFHVDAKWKPNADRKKCVLINEKLYRKICELNAAPGDVVNFQEDVYPIAGTFQHVDYQPGDYHLESSIIVINPMERYDCESYILIPKSGESSALKSAVEKTINQLEPSVVKQMMFNLRDNLSMEMVFIEAIRGVAIILACISLLICLTSILSTVMLDARTRRKEIAIRKVNGARGRDIALLFGKVFAVIVGIALVFAVVAALLFHTLLANMVADINMELSPVAPIILGALVVILFIAVILVWQIRTIMKLDPSGILAKE